MSIAKTSWGFHTGGGTFGQIATESLYLQKKKQYPSQYTATDFKTQYGLRVHDCVGLIKGYLWTDDGKLTYNPAQDKDVSGMLSNCNEIGNIENIPEVEGLLVFKKGHVGVYIGGGKVIEAKGHKYGVIETALKNNNWETYGKLKWISYSADPEEKPITDDEKKETIKKYYGFDNNTIQFFEFYRYGKPLIDKLYEKTQKP